jgi:hypothetical protein
MASCPECGSTCVRRIARTPLMRLLWGSEHILCSDCGERSLTFPKLKKSEAKETVAPQPFQRRPLSRSRRPAHS